MVLNSFGNSFFNKRKKKWDEIVFNTLWTMRFMFRIAALFCGLNCGSWLQRITPRGNFSLQFYLFVFIFCTRCQNYIIHMVVLLSRPLSTRESAFQLHYCEIPILTNKFNEYCECVSANWQATWSIREMGAQFYVQNRLTFLWLTTSYAIKLQLDDSSCHKKLEEEIVRHSIKLANKVYTFAVKLTKYNILQEYKHFIVSKDIINCCINQYHRSFDTLYKHKSSHPLKHTHTQKGKKKNKIKGEKKHLKKRKRRRMRIVARQNAIANRSWNILTNSKCYAFCHFYTCNKIKANDPINGGGNVKRSDNGWCDKNLYDWTSLCLLQSQLNEQMQHEIRNQQYANNNIHVCCTNCVYCCEIENVRIAIAIERRKFEWELESTRLVPICFWCCFNGVKRLKNETNPIEVVASV